MKNHNSGQLNFDKLRKTGKQNLRAGLWRPKDPRDSFRHAVEGLGHAFRTQRNMRFHILVFIAVSVASIILRVPKIEMIALTFCFALVLSTEMLNTALESAADMITDRYNPAAKFVKDAAAGAVLITVVASIIIGLYVFYGALHISTVERRITSPITLPVIFAGFLLLMIVVLVGKSAAGRGSVIRGGAISGHSAAAFFAASLLAYSFPDMWVVIGTFSLAFLVAQSRVEGQIHTIKEVVVGGFIGFFIVFLMIGVPKLLGMYLPNMVGMWQGMVDRAR